MSKVLLIILNEVLNDVAEAMRSTQTTIEEHQARVQDVREEIQCATGRQECAVYEYDQARQRSEVLRTYLSRLGEQPRALVGKMKKLADEQEHAAHSRDEANGYIARVRADLRSQQTQLAVAEKYYAELQKQWDEVSKLILSLQPAT